jgi:hypothetical protein
LPEIKAKTDGGLTKRNPRTVQISSDQTSPKEKKKVTTNATTPTKQSYNHNQIVFGGCAKTQMQMPTIELMPHGANGAVTVKHTSQKLTYKEQN